MHRRIMTWHERLRWRRKKSDDDSFHLFVVVFFEQCGMNFLSIFLYSDFPHVEGSVEEVRKEKQLHLPYPRRRDVSGAKNSLHKINRRSGGGGCWSSPENFFPGEVIKETKKMGKNAL